jgi:hypothetical protein
MEAACSSRMFVYTHNTTEWHNPEDHSLEWLPYENLKAYVSNMYLCVKGVSINFFLLKRFEWKLLVVITFIILMKYLWFLFNFCIL